MRISRTAGFVHVTVVDNPEVFEKRSRSRSRSQIRLPLLANYPFLGPVSDQRAFLARFEMVLAEERPLCVAVRKVESHCCPLMLTGLLSLLMACFALSLLSLHVLLLL